jgi:hypothetical protein
MKTNRSSTLARLGGLTIAVALFGGAAGTLSAGEIPTGKGGASRLLESIGRPVTLKSEPGNYKPMSCTNCKDEFVRRDDWSARGANKPTVIVANHLCGGCHTTIATVGHGKAKTTAAVHKCAGCGAESLVCCSTSKSGVAATKGMEKNFEIAPVK